MHYTYAMKKREVIKLVLDGQKPPYVPWSFKFTEEPLKMLQEHYKEEDMEADRTEMNNLAEENPALASDLADAWEKWALRAFVKPFPESRKKQQK
jgi:hypothetical protein